MAPPRRGLTTEYWLHFKRLYELDRVGNSKFYHTHCRHCLQAHQQDPDHVPPPELVTGNHSGMSQHLALCEFFQQQQTRRSDRKSTTRDHLSRPHHQHQHQHHHHRLHKKHRKRVKSREEEQELEQNNNNNNKKRMTRMRTMALKEEIISQRDQGRDIQQAGEPASQDQQQENGDTWIRRISPSTPPMTFPLGQAMTRVSSPQGVDEPRVNLDAQKEAHEQRVRLNAALQMIHDDVLWTDTTGDEPLQTLMDFCLFLEQQLSTQNMALLRKLLMEVDRQLCRESTGDHPLNTTSMTSVATPETPTSSTLGLFLEFPLHVVVIRPIPLVATGSGVNRSTMANLLRPRICAHEAKARGEQAFKQLEGLLRTNNFMLLREMFEQFCDGKDLLMQRFMLLAIDVITVVPLELPLPRTIRQKTQDSVRLGVQYQDQDLNQYPQAHCRVLKDEILENDGPDQEEDLDEANGGEIKDADEVDAEASTTDCLPSESDNEPVPPPIWRRGPGRHPKVRPRPSPASVSPISSKVAEELAKIRLQRPWKTLVANLRCPFDHHQHQVAFRLWKKFWEDNAEALWERNFWIGNSPRTPGYKMCRARQRSIFTRIVSVVRRIYQLMGLQVFVDVMKQRHNGWFYRPGMVDLRHLEQDFGTEVVIQYVRTQAAERFPSVPGHQQQHQQSNKWACAPEEVVWASHPVVGEIKRALKQVMQKEQAALDAA